jgi:uncharacterized protein YeaO (DUF488 family)
MPGHRAPGIDVRRVYEDDPDGTGYRVLVDRLWPRGIKKEAAALDEWARHAAPSAELRRWYGHDRSKFHQFARRYREELSRSPASAEVARLRSLARDRHVTLLTATRDVEHSGARVLRDHLVAHDR